MNNTTNNQYPYNKICEQCQSKVSNKEVLVSVWRVGKTSVLNCTNCHVVKNNKITEEEFGEQLRKDTI